MEAHLLANCFVLWLRVAWTLRKRHNSGLSQWKYGKYEVQTLLSRRSMALHVALWMLVKGCHCAFHDSFASVMTRLLHRQRHRSSLQLCSTSKRSNDDIDL